MSNINFDNPLLLLIAIPLLILVAVSFILVIRKENRTFNNIFSLICHILIVVLLSLAFAKTTYETVMTETNIYVLADVSYSSNENLELIDKYIDDLKDNVPKNSKIGIVCFGKDYELLVEPGEEIISVKNANVDVGATNICSALEYTATLFKDNVIKRIVIISDGEETDDSNIVSVVQSLASDDIYIDAIYLDNNIDENSKEIQVNQVEYVDSTFLNIEEKVNATIQTSFDTKAIVTLYYNDEIYSEKAVFLNKGYNMISLGLNTSESGDHTYKFVVNSDEDTSSFNNTFIFNQVVSEKKKILFISGDKADRENAENLYGDSSEIDYYINDGEVPFTVEDLCVYDEFILSNIDIRKLYNYSQFVKSIDTLVSEFGKSLVTFGNTYIQNNYDDETLSALSDMLPVKYGNNSQEEKLVTIVLDISRSMEFDYRLQCAKNAAMTILDNLDDNVNVMIVPFFGEVGQKELPRKASEREYLKEVIKNYNVYQGTFMGSALENTYSTIKDFPYEKNEVILITDGLPYGEQKNQVILYAQKMAESNIMLSVIHTIIKESVDFTKQVAEAGKGYHYFLEKVEQVESLVLNEVLNSLTEVILEANPSSVSILRTKEDLVKGIDELPNINGLYNNVKKSSAKVVLEAKYTDTIGNKYDVPLYSYWNYGNGKVSSFATSISGDWISDWYNSDDAKTVLMNIDDFNIPEKRVNSSFIIDTHMEGTNTEIIVTAPSLNSGSELTINIIYPDGTEESKLLAFDSQKYITDIKTDKAGKYVIQLSYKLGELSYSAEYVFNISYLPEYNKFTIFEASNLYYMVSENGQISETGELRLENDNSTEQKYIIDFTPAFMIICVILFVLDVIVRKLRLQDIKSLFGLSKKKKFVKQERRD